MPEVGERRSAAQRHALEAVVRQIRACDPNNRRKYLREYNEAFRSYESVLSPDDLDRLLASAGVVLVGDYHALAASQRFAAEIVQRLHSLGRSVVFGVEMVFARDQHILDEWSAGEISDDELRDRIRFDVDWGYEWQPYCELLRSARAAGARICGLDCMPRSDMRRIGARDRHAATKISELRALYPDSAIAVLFGESHLAPNHLPSEVKTCLPAERVLTVLQNNDALYWRAAGELRGSVEAVQVADDVVCVFNSTPLEKYESYRLCIERWMRTPAERPDFTPSVYNLVGALARALNIDPYSPHNGTQPRFLVDQLPEICVRSSTEAALRCLERKRIARHEIKAAEQALARGGMAYVQSLNTIFMTRWELSGAAEPVAHFVHCACRGVLTLPHTAPATTVASALPDNAFYARVLEIAFADFGARVLYPARPAARESDLFSLYSEPREKIEEQSILSYRDYMRMIDFVVYHRDYQRNLRKYWETPLLIVEGRQYTGERFEFVTRKLGEMLGTDLYEAYITGVVKKRFIRSLLFRRLDKPGVARVAYFAAVRRTRKKPRAV
jgi:hypothetical protein